MRPLLFSGERLFCSKANHIVATSDLGLTFEDVCTLKLPRALKLATASSLSRRIARTDTYRMRELAGGNRVFVFRKGIYVQQAESKTAVCTMQISRGSRPVSLECNPSGDVVFGEYFSNPARDAVHIYSSSDGGLNWQVVYTFKPGSVRHIHGISYDRWNDCYWICTGDYGDENQLLRATCDFSNVQVVRKGGQHNRFFSLQIFEKYIVAATDTPFESNYVMVIDKQSGEARRALEIENSVFYTCVVDDRIFVSTNAERSANNDSDNSHVWMSHRSLMQWDRVLTRPVDMVDRIGRLPCFRNGFFQHPHYVFPDGINPTSHLVTCGVGLQGQDDTLMVHDVRSSIQEESIDFAKAA